MNDRYAQAAERNVTNLLRFMKNEHGPKLVCSEFKKLEYLNSIDAEQLAFLKERTGIRKTDTTFDTRLLYAVSVYSIHRRFVYGYDWQKHLDEFTRAKRDRILLGFLKEAEERNYSCGWEET